MNYSSVAHLSSQFKKVTGLSPSHFKQLKDKTKSNRGNCLKNSLIFYGKVKKSLNYKDI
jgi:AraC-like DNA-binding protein